MTKNVYKNIKESNNEENNMRSVYFHVSSKKVEENKVENKKMGLLVENPVYKPFRYPWCYEFVANTTMNVLVTGHVPLGDDVRDWQKNLSVEEKILTHIFRFFYTSRC